MTMAITERCLTNMGVKSGEPGFLKDWTGSDGEYPVEKEASCRKKDEQDLAAVKKTAATFSNITKYPQVPKEIMAECKVKSWRGDWKKVIQGLYKYSVYQKRIEDKYYPGKSTRRNRCYSWSQQWLADRLGLHRWTVQKWLRKFEVAGIVYVCYHGYIGRGASIYELAYNEAHRLINRQRTRTRKRKSLLVGVGGKGASSSRCRR